MIEVQIKNHQQSYFGIESISYINPDIKNLLRLRSLQSTVSIRQDIPEAKEDFLKKLGYSYYTNGNCPYWKSMNYKDNFGYIRFDKQNLSLSITDANEEIFQSFILMFCKNPGTEKSGKSGDSIPIN